MNIKKDIRFRVYIAFTCLFLFGCAIIIKAAMIQVKEGPKLRKMAQEAHTRIDTVPAERGNIYTEDGVLLSSSIPEFDVHIDFTVIDSGTFSKNIDSLCLCLSRLMMDKSQDAYKEELVRAYNADNMYYPLFRRKLKYFEFEQLRNFPIFRKGKEHGGLIAESKEKRELPYDKLARRTIGTFREEAMNGLEAKYNSYLKGESGHRVVQKSTGNVWMPIEGSEVEPQNGKDIVTTLDVNVQDAAAHALMSILTKYKCEYGTCIVMEVKTGKIRTLVNLGRLSDSTYEENLNYATIPTEPGSTFKLATLLSLLNDKMVNVDQTVDAEGGAIRFGSSTMRDSHLGLHEMPIWKAFAESSNAAFAKLANTYYHDNPKKFVDHIVALRLDTLTGIDLLGERRGRVIKPADRDWSAITLPWMAAGYNVLITPLHTCMLYNAIANDGKMMKPYLVSSIKEYDKEIKTFEPTVLETVGDSSVIAQVRRCTRAVVTEGTAKGIESPFYTISGKTGTAQVADGSIKYSDGVYQGSFVGYFPAEHPKYTICVVIRTKPHSAAYYGGAIAAPVFKMVADKIFSENIGAWAGPLDSLTRTASPAIPAMAATMSSYEAMFHALKKRLPIPASVENYIIQSVADSSRNMVVNERTMYRGVVPNVIGMGLKDAVYMLETAGMNVRIQGKGRVKQQSVTPGTKIEKGQNIILQLS